MSEGLFRLGDIQTPFDPFSVASGVTRVETPVYFVTTVFPDHSSLATFVPPPADRPTASGCKVFLEEGVVLWYVNLTRLQLETIDDRLSPAWFEIARGFEGVAEFPAQRILRMEGGAAAFCVAPNGTLLTNYHVAREEIEGQYRTEGAHTPVPCCYLRAAAGPGLMLCVNPSRDDWKAGRDWTILRLPGDRLPALPLAQRLPRVGEPVWSFGFPMRTKRASSAYADADGGLRIASGRVTELRGTHLFATDLDGFSGNSGGPVVDAGGAVLGIVHNVDPASEQSRRGTVYRGGMLCVSVGPGNPGLWAALRVQRIVE